MPFSLQRAAAATPRLFVLLVLPLLRLSCCACAVIGDPLAPPKRSAHHLLTRSAYTTDGSFTALVARRLPASHNHLTGEVNGGVTYGLVSSSPEHGVHVSEYVAVSTIFPLLSLRCGLALNPNVQDCARCPKGASEEPCRQRTYVFRDLALPFRVSLSSMSGPGCRLMPMS